MTSNKSDETSIFHIHEAMHELPVDVTLLEAQALIMFKLYQPVLFA